MSDTELVRVSEEYRQVSHITSSRLVDSLFSKDLAPHYMELAKKLATSELVPKGFRGKPQDLFIAWAMGYQVGLAPEQAMQCITIINGKPAMWGDDMLALCMAHKEFEDIDERPIRDKNDAIIGFVCTVKRKGKMPKINEFTLDMAKKAGLLAKGGVWAQYPERMLKLRARGFTLRDAFPDALKGIKPREEVEDYIEGEYSHGHKQSRTDVLREQIKSNKESTNAEPITTADSAYEDSLARGEIAQDIESEEMGAVGEKAIDLGAEVDRLFIEKEFTSERIAKALAYYEVKHINELSDESASHLIAKLNKL